MADAVIKEAREKMEKSLAAFQTELTHIRTGRASPALLDSIEVDAYGSKMKLNQLGSVSVPEARMIVVQPWDKSQMGAIEKAIQASPLDITPSNDGTVIRIPLPPLTEERRKDLVKLVGKLAEEARVSIRNIRRHEIDATKKRQKDNHLPEDEAHRITTEIQHVTDSFIGKIDAAFKAKEDEIMEV